MAQTFGNVTAENCTPVNYLSSSDGDLAFIRYLLLSAEDPETRIPPGLPEPLIFTFNPRITMDGCLMHFPSAVLIQFIPVRNTVGLIIVNQVHVSDFTDVCNFQTALNSTGACHCISENGVCMCSFIVHGTLSGRNAETVTVIEHKQCGSSVVK